MFSSCERVEVIVPVVAASCSAEGRVGGRGLKGPRTIVRSGKPSGGERGERRKVSESRDESSRVGDDRRRILGFVGDI